MKMSASLPRRLRACRYGSWEGLRWIAWVVLGLLGDGTWVGAAEDPRGPGTVKMAELLVRVAGQVEPLNTRFLTAGQVTRWEAKFRETPELRNDPATRFKYADALLNSGRNREALAEYDAVESLTRAAGHELSASDRVQVRLNQALCHLREAERLNCLTNHNAESCLMPLRGGGIHREKAPSRAAFGVLTNLLAEFPGDLSARWLLNVTAMTLGEYPAGVPERWRIPESAFFSDIPFPRFREVGVAAGVADNQLSGASVVDDFDGDGLLDIVVTSFGLLDPMRYYRNRGDGTFEDRTRAAGLEGIVGGLSAVQTDYDNDGHLDLFIPRGAWNREEGKYPNSLLRNRGDGTFEDVTEAAGLLSFHPTQVAVWFDFDGDGWLDLFIGNESIPAVSRHPSELYRNLGNGRFVEMARGAGVTVGGYVKGATAGDFNNDGRPDLYVSLLGGQNRLFRNDGPRDAARGAAGGWVFTDVALEAGVVEPIHSFPCWFFDFDDDGWEDIWVTGYKITGVGDIAADYLGLPNAGTRARLYRNLGNGKFADVTKEARVDRIYHAMGSNFGDLDNDGWLDMYLGTGDPDLLTVIPNRALRNAGGRFFQDVTTAAGLGHLQKGHGVSFADLDNDGDQDIHEDMGGAVSGDVYPNVLFENPGMGNHWLKLTLEGTKANRCAIGARVAIEVEEAGKRRILHRTVGPGGSFGANPLRLEVGVGQAERILGAEILWPGSGTRQRVTGLERDRAYRVKEGEAAAQAWTPRKFSFSGKAGEHHSRH